MEPHQQEQVVCVICGITLYAHDDWYELEDKFDAIQTDNGYVCYGCWMHTRTLPIGESET